jgi:hypothetical protein
MISLMHRTIASMLTIATTAILAAGCGDSYGARKAKKGKRNT